jgi:hypothetical protein
MEKPGRDLKLSTLKRYVEATGVNCALMLNCLMVPTTDFYYKH